MLFENNDYVDMLFNLNGVNYGDFNKNNYMNSNMKNNVTAENQISSEGFLRGNMFENLYVPYKNYKYQMPKLKSEKDRMLFKIMEYSFMINDYNLYLDVHPNDTNIFTKFKTASNDLKELTRKYESMYGPLELEDTDKSFNWIDSPWPWEREDAKYV